MPIDIEAIKKLRSMTGVGLTAAKQALVEASGDFDKAVEAMRIKGIAKAEKKADRQATIGVVHGYVHAAKIGVLVEVNCETDFVARTDDFKEFVNNLALHIAASAPQFVSVNDIPEEIVVKEKKLVEAELAEQKKPAGMIEKIASGKLDKFKAEISLLEQLYVKDPSKTIGDYLKETAAKLGENIVVRRFYRLEIGSY